MSKNESQTDGCGDMTAIVEIEKLKVKVFI